MELAASEAERARLVSAARTAELASRALRAQLAEAGVAFRAAMGTAQGFLQQGGCRNPCAGTFHENVSMGRSSG